MVIVFKEFGDKMSHLIGMWLKIILLEEVGDKCAATCLLQLDLF
jgi:hypothetical protein